MERTIEYLIKPIKNSAVLSMFFRSIWHLAELRLRTMTQSKIYMNEISRHGTYISAFNSIDIGGTHCRLPDKHYFWPTRNHIRIENRTRSFLAFVIQIQKKRAFLMYYVATSHTSSSSRFRTQIMKQETNNSNFIRIHNFRIFVCIIFFSKWNNWRTKRTIMSYLPLPAKWPSGRK